MGCTPEDDLDLISFSLQLSWGSVNSSPAQYTTGANKVADLRAKVAAMGETLGAEQEFVDDGYSGATLIRPALERLRDVIAAGEIDRLYVHCPDRLARNYAHQVLLLDEFVRAGVEVVFLNREVGQTPEDQLLLQVQGMIAEYERAKILERSRRGKRHGAQMGSVSVLSCAPYGYRYVNTQDSGGEARFDIILKKHESCARSLNGSDGTAAPLARCNVA
jgi:site-specific DNA recombinase